MIGICIDGPLLGEMISFDRSEMGEIERLTELCAGFRNAMEGKLHAKARQGWRGWDHPSVHRRLRLKLIAHVKKAKTADDYIDVGAFAAFLWDMKRERP